MNDRRKIRPARQASARPPSTASTLRSRSTRTAGFQRQFHTEPYPPWDPLFPYNNLPPVPGKQLTTRAVERRCKLVTAALDALRDATRKLAAPYASFQTATLIEAQASSVSRAS